MTSSTTRRKRALTNTYHKFNTGKMKDHYPSFDPKPCKEQLIINELLETEKKFVNTLKILETVFVKQLRKKQVLSNEELEKVFSNSAAIYQLQSNFLARLLYVTDPSVHCAPNENDVFYQCNTISEIFEEYAKYANIFITYCTNHSELVSKKHLKQLQQSNARFEKFLQDKQKLPETNRQTLQSLLTSIPQRICRYPLLLQELINKREPDAESEQLLNALNTFNNLLKEINNNTIVTNDFGMLLEIQKIIDIPSNMDFQLGQPGRVYLHRGDFKVLKPYKHFGDFAFLFNDVLLICNRKSENNFNLTKIIHLKNIILRTLVHPTIIQINEVSNNVFYVEFLNTWVKDKWISLLSSTLSSPMSGRLKKKQSYSSTTLSKFSDDIDQDKISFTNSMMENEIVKRKEAELRIKELEFTLKSLQQQIADQKQTILDLSAQVSQKEEKMAPLSPKINPSSKKRTSTYSKIKQTPIIPDVPDSPSTHLLQVETVKASPLTLLKAVKEKFVDFSHSQDNTNKHNVDSVTIDPKQEKMETNLPNLKVNESTNVSFAATTRLKVDRYTSTPPRLERASGFSKSCDQILDYKIKRNTSGNTLDSEGRNKYLLTEYFTVKPNKIKPTCKK